MKWNIIFVLFAFAFLFCIQLGTADNNEFEDNEFAEFEDFEDGGLDVVKPEAEVDEKPSVMDDEDEEENDAFVETESDDFDEWDPEEYEKGDPEEIVKKPENGELKITQVPHRRKSWTNYYVEIVIGTFIAIYLTNFIMGSSKNSSIAASWLQTHLEFLKSQFELVGDDPTAVDAVSTNQMIKECEHNYVLWCSGRQMCEGMLVQLKLLKRQDMISNIVNRFQPANDQIHISITLEHMEPFVFCMGLRRSVIALQKNMNDVGMFCGDKMRSAEKLGFSSSMVILSELPSEVNTAILDGKVAKVLKDNERFIDSIHISDQFSGPKPSDQDEVPVKEPDTAKVINITLNMPQEWSGSVENMVEMLPLVKLTVYLIDKISRLRLSREGKQRADRHRQEMHLRFLKQTHAQRQEAAQLKREEKEKLLKERMMAEEDPDKQRRMDEQIQRREQSKKQKKMMKGRQFKVKAM